MLQKRMVFPLSLVLLFSWTLHLEAMDNDEKDRALKRSYEVYVAAEQNNPAQEAKDDVDDSAIAERKKVTVVYTANKEALPVSAPTQSIPTARDVVLAAATLPQPMPAVNPISASLSNARAALHRAMSSHVVNNTNNNANALSAANDRNQSAAQAAPVQRPRFSFIRDAYTARRGEPAMLDIRCQDCDRSVMHYQKDGPGRLLRCYLDRIRYPAFLERRQDDRFDVRRSPLLKCVCNAVIGRPMIYQPEKRPAYQMFGARFRITDITQRGQHE